MATCWFASTARVACEHLAAIAAVGGANQFAAASEPCAAGTAVFQMHGTEDKLGGYGVLAGEVLVRGAAIRLGLGLSREL